MNEHQWEVIYQFMIGFQTTLEEIKHLLENEETPGERHERELMNDNSNVR